MVKLLANGVLALDERACDGEPDALVEPGDDVRARELLREGSNHQLVAVAFPKFTDGRGYSSAAILREGGFTGDIRAVGDVTIDQLVYLKRVGFSSIQPNKPITVDAAKAALARFPNVYRAAADGQPPAWRLRHG
ncbi:MAG: DUF934 domain-containing protein [Sphingomonadaceae bacterium]